MQHREIGMILGFPECCIDAWIADREQAAIRRGIVMLRERTTSERAILRPQLEKLTTPQHVDAILDGCMEYVPCTNCVGSVGWRGWKTTKGDNL